MYHGRVIDTDGHDDVVRVGTCFHSQPTYHYFYNNLIARIINFAVRVVWSDSDRV